MISKAKNVSIKRRISYLGLGNLINAVTNLLMIPYLARALAREEYASYGQVLMVFGVLTVLFSIGLPKLIHKNLSVESESDQKDECLNAIVNAIFFGMLGAFLIYFLADGVAAFFNNGALSSLLKIYALSLVFTSLVQLFSSILNYLKLVRELSVANIANNLIRILLLFCSIQFFEEMEYIAFALLTSSIISTLIMLYYIPFRIFGGKLSRSLMFQQMSEGFPLGLSGIVTFLIVQTDGIMISRMLPTEQYAYYRMGAIPIPFLLLIYTSIITVTLPEVNRLFKRGEVAEISRLKRRSGLAIVFFTYPLLIFLLVFFREFVALFFGENYIPSQWVFLIYNLIIFLRISDFRDVLIAAGQSRFILLADTILFAFNLILNYFFIRWFSIEGAAIASLMSFYLLSALLQHRTSRLLKISFTSFFELNKMVKVILSSMILSFICYFTYTAIPSIIFLFILAPLYTALIYLFLLKLQIIKVAEITTYTEKVKLLAPVNKFLNKLQ